MIVVDADRERVIVAAARSVWPDQRIHPKDCMHPHLRGQLPGLMVTEVEFGEPYISVYIPGADGCVGASRAEIDTFERMTGLALVGVGAHGYEEDEWCALLLEFA